MASLTLGLWSYTFIIYDLILLAEKSKASLEKVVVYGVAAAQVAERLLTRFLV